MRNNIYSREREIISKLKEKEENAIFAFRMTYAYFYAVDLSFGDAHCKIIDMIYVKPNGMHAWRKAIECNTSLRTYHRYRAAIIDVFYRYYDNIDTVRKIVME